MKRKLYCTTSASIITIKKFSNLIGYQQPCVSTSIAHAIARANSTVALDRRPFPTYFLNITVVSTFSETCHLNILYLSQSFVLVTNQIGLPLRGRPIGFIICLISDRIKLHSVLLPLLIIQSAPSVICTTVEIQWTQPI